MITLNHNASLLSVLLTHVGQLQEQVARLVSHHNEYSEEVIQPIKPLDVLRLLEKDVPPTFDTSALRSEIDSLRYNVRSLSDELEREKQTRRSLEYQINSMRETTPKNETAKQIQMIQDFTKQAEIEAMTEEFSRKMQRGFDEVLKKSFSRIDKIEHDVTESNNHIRTVETIVRTVETPIRSLNEMIEKKLEYELATLRDHDKLREKEISNMNFIISSHQIAIEGLQMKLKEGSPKRKEVKAQPIIVDSHIYESEPILSYEPVEPPKRIQQAPVIQKIVHQQSTHVSNDTLVGVRRANIKSENILSPSPPQSPRNFKEITRTTPKSQHSLPTPATTTPKKTLQQSPPLHTPTTPKLNSHIKQPNASPITPQQVPKQQPTVMSSPQSSNLGGLYFNVAPAQLPSQPMGHKKPSKKTPNRQTLVGDSGSPPKKDSDLYINTPNLM